MFNLGKEIYITGSNFGVLLYYIDEFFLDAVNT